MKQQYILLLITLLVVIGGVAYYFVNQRKSNGAELVEFDSEPDDNDGPMDEDEVGEIEEFEAMMGDSTIEEFEEDFRIRGGGGVRPGGGGVRPGGGGVRPGGGGIRPGGGGVRPGGGGVRPGRPGRPGSGRFPRRPWRSYNWRSFPYYYPYYSYGYSYYPYYYYYDYPVYSADYNPIQRYTVRLTPKTDIHPFSDKGYAKGFAIATGAARGCGTPGARLELRRGQTYEFDVYTERDCVTGERESEPFFFTRDPEGGSDLGAIFNVKPTTNGVLRITIDSSVPDKFYYQSSDHDFVGGYVFVV